MNQVNLPPRRFPGQKPDEEIKLLLRKHWIIDVRIFLVFVLLALLPLVFYLGYLIFFWPEEGLTSNHYLGLLAFLSYFLFALLITYVKWLNEELDIVIVTNERIISHDQQSLFHRQISETHISQVQEVKGVEKGMFGNVLSYGNLSVQTAAEKTLFEIRNVRDPEENARHLMELRSEWYQESEKTLPPPLPST